MKKEKISYSIKKIIRVPYVAIRNNLLDIRARHYIRRLNKKTSHDGKIKVGFIVQMAEIWDKEERIYELMCHDDRFSPFLLVCPAFDFTNKLIKKSYDDNYFFENYSNAIRLYENDEWLDIKESNFDYVFYQRPYDWYLPNIYRSRNIVKYAKCCYVPYAFWPFMNELCGYNKEFYSNVYFAFMESDEHCKAIQKRENDRKRIVYKGYPSLDGIIPETKSEYNSILWTPRWSYDSVIGGSHFFEYKEEMINLKRKNENMHIIIRPHPLAFDNYVRMGMMTDSDVLSYKQRILSVGISFDSNKKIEDSFKETDILITDISSIIFPFFLTEKPIIFCNTDVELSPEIEIILKGMYIANSWEDIERFITELQSGIDSLKEVRHTLAEKYRKEYFNSANKIINTLIEDFNK